MTNRAGRRAMLVILIVAWCAAFAGTHTPADRLPEFHTSDKTLHAAGYAVLAGLFWLTLAVHGHRRRRRILLVICVMATYAAVDELTQPLFNRWASFDDWLFDLLGAAAAVAIAECISLIKHR